ncbi:MAG: class I SAM-dependent methyltransferase [Eubacteriales bacterium]|nr:class I SAM-dependent methyltransferase [Eubacteriales bacterium]
MELRKTFNEDAANYDRYRPDYPREMMDEIAAYAHLGAGSTALEMGPGTGQATQAVLETSCRVTAAELGENLANFLAQKFAHCPSLEVRQGDFMQLSLPQGSYDLFFSGTAFHWLPRAQALARVKSLLKPGGTAALFWNHPFPALAQPALFQEMQAAYRRHRPGSAVPTPFSKESCAVWQDALAAAGYVQVETRLFHRVRRMDAAAYRGLLNTYSDHRSMETAAREGLERDLSRAVDAHGGVLEIADTVDLYLARSPW